ncbi:MAG: nucleoside triphosphate pyrophosphatase [Halarsenatibacteraceae bacterium]
MKESMKLILASASPRRKELLNRLKLDFKVEPSKINEDQYKAENPIELVKLLAVEKAREVGSRYDNGIIIAADTIVVLDKRILGKPADKKEAIKMLESLSGREHDVHTGIAFLIKDQNNSRLISDIDSSIVKMRNYNIDEINSYINTGEYKGKAGSYAIQGFGSLLVKEIKGSYFTIMGLPIHKLAEVLPEYDINLYNKKGDII